MEKFQIDFIKVKTQKVNRETVNWDMLNEHPTIRNAYTLDEKSGLYGKNFKLYFTKNDNAVLETSVPYLIHGHNYVKMFGLDLVYVFARLQELIGIDFLEAEVLQYEFGGFKAIKKNSKDYIKSVIGLGASDLKYSSTFMKIFGNSMVNFKIYDAVANAKKKKTFKLGKYPNGDLIKYELKFIKPKQYFGKEILVQDLISQEFQQTMVHFLNEHLLMIIDVKSSQKEANSFSLNNVLYSALKLYEYKTGIDAFNFINTFIDACAMTPSQKSKRRNAVKRLESHHNYQNK